MVCTCLFNYGVSDDGLDACSLGISMDPSGAFPASCDLFCISTLTPTLLDVSKNSKKESTRTILQLTRSGQQWSPKKGRC